jgi:hypothetical protein
MVMGMVPHLMTFGQNTFVEFRVFPHIVTHHKEGGSHTELLQCVEYEWCSLWDGTIIESQVD